MTEQEPELPPCFTAWCPLPYDEWCTGGCGWKGRGANRFPDAYTFWLGENVPIRSSPEYKDPIVRCPKCRRPAHRLVTKEAFAQRFRWAVDHTFTRPGKDPADLFPCTCKAPAPLRIHGPVFLSRCTMGDACFASDNDYLRMMSDVKCCGCYAVGRLAVIEVHHSLTLWRDREVEPLLLKAGHCPGVEIG